MRTQFILLIIAILPISNLEAMTRSESARDALEAWAAAFNSNDSEVLLEFYDNSNETVVVVSSGTLVSGLESFESVVRTDFQFVTFSDSRIEDVHERQLTDEVSVFTFEHRFVANVTEEDTRLQGHVQTTIVMQKLDGIWKIVSEHSSALPDVERMVPIDENGNPLEGEAVPAVPENDSIDYVELPMTDPEATKQFYATHFDWEFEDWGADYISFSGAGVTGGFNSALSTTGLDNGPLIVMYSDDLDGKLQELRDAGCEIAREVSFPGGRRFLFVDPNGNHVGVWTAIEE
ncbi:MAG: nuclear transport factor 2 family protein [Planctomycetota bacterium]